MKSPASAEPAVSYGKSNAKVAEIFTVVRAGKKKNYEVKSGFGFFITPLRKAKTLAKVDELMEEGFTWEQVAELISFLELKVPELAKATFVSASTVSRWEAKSPVGVPGSNQLFRIDEVIRKGVELFGGLDEFKQWLDSPNMALGNKVPVKLLTSQIGIDMVDEALDALHYGNVM